MSESDFTIDRFLGGRVAAAQPRTGFRAGHDTVFLAAAVPAKEGEDVLEFGSGAGIASLCLAARIGGVRILGIETNDSLVRLANENAMRNGMAERVRFLCGRAETDAPGRDSHHVFFNPPFHPDAARKSPNVARDLAMRDSAGFVGRWTQLALALVKKGGTVTVIVRADRQNEILTERQGDHTAVFPLLPHAAEPPKRVIVQIRKGSPGKVDLLPGLVLHEQTGNNTVEAEAVLRHGKALPLI